MSSSFLNTFLLTEIKLNMSGWVVKICMMFHVSLSSCKRCVSRHLRRSLTTLCSHQGRRTLNREGIVPAESIWICVAERSFKRQGRNLPCIYRLGHPSVWWNQGANWNTRPQRKSNAFYGLKVYIYTNQLKKARAWSEALSYEQPCCLIAIALPGMIWFMPSSTRSSNIHRIQLVQRLCS